MSHFTAIFQVCLTYFTLNCKCQPHGGAKGKVRGPPVSLGFIPWGPENVQNVTAIHLMVAEVLYFSLKSKWWTEDRHGHPQSYATSTAKISTNPTFLNIFPGL